MRAYLELVRLPNLFTAMADVMLGFFAVRSLETGGDVSVLALLLATSAALYAAGVVLNDLADLSEDHRERPDRPLPSGRISPTAAARLAVGLFVAGMALGGAAALAAPSLRTGVTTGALAAAIVAYDVLLKRTPLGPVAMGGCRTLNVLLGATAAGDPWAPAHWLIAAGVGTYVAGVTWFARGEAGWSRRAGLLGGIAVMTGGMALLAWLPEWQAIAGQPGTWRMLVLVLGLLVVWQCRGAVVEPSPRRVQWAVKKCILSLVILDAAVCLALAGPAPAIAVIALVAPAALLGRWIRLT